MDLKNCSKYQLVARVQLFQQKIGRYNFRKWKGKKWFLLSRNKSSENQTFSGFLTVFYQLQGTTWNTIFNFWTDLTGVKFYLENKLLLDLSWIEWVWFGWFELTHATSVKPLKLSNGCKTPIMFVLAFHFTFGLVSCNQLHAHTDCFLNICTH